MTDNETTAAIEALVYRVKARDKAIRDGGDYPDAEPFALEFLTALRGQGWRHTEAKAFAPPKPVPAGEDTGPSEATRAELEAARQRMDAINAARAEREAGAA